MFKKDKEFEERYSALRKAINQKYSLLEIVKQYNPQATESTFKMSSILNIHDTNPSFSVNYPKKVWKCFSTGKGGGYIELLYWTQKMREGSNRSIFQLADEILKSDRDLQKQLGMGSLFRTQIPDTVEFELRSNRIAKNTGKRIKPFPKIVDELSKLDNKQPLLNFIDDFERNMSIKDLQRKYSDTQAGEITHDDKEELENLITNLFG